jgi:hypothetical protein
VETEHYRFQVIETPGHSPDHICLFEPDQGWLFSGDAIIASLKTLADLPVQTIFSGSGSVRHKGTKPLQEKIAYLEDLGDQIRALHAQGLSPRHIRKQLLGRELPITYLTLGHFSGARLIQSYLAGLPPPEPNLKLGSAANG